MIAIFMFCSSASEALAFWPLLRCRPAPFPAIAHLSGSQQLLLP
jgi:hypothetical protein